MNPITLFIDSQYASPYAMAVYVTLIEKGIPFETEALDLSAGAQHKPPYRDKSLTAKIPAILHDDFFLSESSAIIEYLDECFSGSEYPSVYPQGMADRARTRQIQAWLRSDLLPIRAERPTEVIFFGERCPPLSAVAQAEADKLSRVATTLLEHGGDNLFRDWSIVDMELALMLNRLVLNGDDVPQHLVDYATSQWARSSVQEWVNKAR